MENNWNEIEMFKPKSQHDLVYPGWNNYRKICEAAVTLTGARALVVRGGDGGRDSTGSGGGVALLAIPRSPLPRGHGPDESACIL